MCVRQDKRCITTVQRQLDNPVLRVGDDGAEFVPLLEVLSSAANIGMNPEDESVTRRHHVASLKTLDPVLEVLNLPLRGEKGLLSLAEVAPSDSD